ncbi:MAG: hypothetical protein AAF665_03570 [Pseudomonadota bacterium]
MAYATRSNSTTTERNNDPGGRARDRFAPLNMRVSATGVRMVRSGGIPLL